MICPTCGHNNEPKRPRNTDPAWTPCTICRGSTWKTTSQGTTLCTDCDNGYTRTTTPPVPLEPQPTPPKPPTITSPAAAARAALTQATRNNP